MFAEVRLFDSSRAFFALARRTNSIAKPQFFRIMGFQHLFLISQTLSLMRILILSLFGVLLLSAGLSAQAPFVLQPFASGLVEPTDIANAGDERLFIVEKGGRIQVLDARGNKLPTPFLNIASKLSAGSERGLLGLVFHPDYASNGYFYVNYTNTSGNTTIARYSVDPSNPNLALASSEFIIMTINQPFSNHNAGDLNFGPDGYLYIAMGDGGSGGDPGNRSQTKTNLLGKVLRIDVDGGSPYAIPPDNPFVGDPSYAPEIWALGVRNPWRCSFDALTGDYWIADVGQDLWEEINVQPASSTGGENYGWRCYEGNAPYNLSGCLPASNYDFPVFVYNHSFASGGFSVTGGYVYRGSGNPDLQGHYIFCDYLSGRWWSLKDDGAGGYNSFAYGALQSLISSFGEDYEGELYAANLSSGVIYKLTPNCSSTVRVTGLDAQVLGPNSVNVGWDPLPGAQGYQINGRPVGSSGFGKVQTTSTNRTINILTPSTAYEWFVRARCNDLSITLNSDLKNFNTPALRIQEEALIVITDVHAWYYEARSEGHWSLHDLAGRLLMQGQQTEGRNSISNQGLPAGLYVLSSNQGNAPHRSSLVTVMP